MLCEVRYPWAILSYFNDALAMVQEWRDMCACELEGRRNVL